MNFKSFLTDSENKDVEKTLAKLPKAHRDFVSKYKISFQGGCTLKGDGDHIGEVDDVKKRIIVAAPWNYPREFCLLHEIAHLVWGKFVSDEQKKTWKDLCKKTKLKKNARQNEEELFCQGYAATYCKRPPTDYFHEEWVKFIKSL